MPTAAFQEFYWDLSLPSTAAGTSGVTQYPAWQRTVIAPSLFGALGAWWDDLWATFRWWRRFHRRIQQRTPEEWAVVESVLDWFESPAYAYARRAVWETAHSDNFREPSVYGPYAKLMKADFGRALNVYRHVKAMELTQQALAVPGPLRPPLTHPQLNWGLEATYQVYARAPWSHP